LGQPLFPVDNVRSLVRNLITRNHTMAIAGFASATTRISPGTSRCNTYSTSRRSAPLCPIPRIRNCMSWNQEMVSWNQKIEALKPEEQYQRLLQRQHQRVVAALPRRRLPGVVMIDTQARICLPSPGKREMKSPRKKNTLTWCRMAGILDRETPGQTREPILPYVHFGLSRA
jgi:hypothetical protein